MSDYILLTRKEEEPEYRQDVEKMLGWLKEEGYSASPGDIRWAWEQHSESMDAGWLYCDNKEQAVSTMLYYLTEKEINS